jgi:hypothetical protein
VTATGFAPADEVTHLDLSAEYVEVVSGVDRDNPPDYLVAEHHG